jgi:Domain of unknown function (DUF4395)
MRRLFGFPNPVNETAARVVASGVVVLTVLTLALQSTLLLWLLCAGFCARVLTGPTLSPLGQFAVRVAAPRLTSTPRYVPGPPKRFAQGVGAAFSTAAVLCEATVGWPWASALLALLLVAASLEAFLGYCLGCTVFGWMMRAGVVPRHVCEECADLSARYVRANEA